MPIAPDAALGAGDERPWWRPYPADVVLVAVLVVPCLVFDSVGNRPLETIVPINALLLAPLLFRRAAPEVSALFVTFACLVQLALGDTSPRPADVAALVVVYTVAAFGRTWAVPLVIAVGAIGSVVGGVAFSGLGADVFTLGVALFLVVAMAWTAGLLRRAVASREKAVRENANLARSERAQQAVIAASHERSRIARDLHDVVAHSVAVMIAQADGGRYAATSDPAAATQALETIADTGRQALSEIRRLVGVLRQPDDAGEGTAPQPGLADIPDLVKRLRANGLSVTLEWRGDATPVDAGPALATYRIVQESLTNVLKHAGPRARAWITITWAVGLLVVEVADDGVGTHAVAGDDQGLGHLGMRERAALYGGSVDVGARPGGGYAVRAIIPIGHAGAAQAPLPRISPPPQVSLAPGTQPTVVLEKPAAPTAPTEVL